MASELEVLRWGRIDLTLATAPASVQGGGAYAAYGRLGAMQGEREALVVEAASLDVHGVGYVDVTVAYRDRSVETARLGRESVPLDLSPGEEVLVSRVVNMVVAIRRPTAS